MRIAIYLDGMMFWALVIFLRLCPGTVLDRSLRAREQKKMQVRALPMVSFTSFIRLCPNHCLMSLPLFSKLASHLLPRSCSACAWSIAHRAGQKTNKTNKTYFIYVVSVCANFVQICFLSGYESCLLFPSGASIFQILNDFIFI